MFLFGLLLVGCDVLWDDVMVFGLVLIVSGDECYVCGMFIEEMFGFKGEVVFFGVVCKFCFIVELFGWWL